MRFLEKFSDLADFEDFWCNLLEIDMAMVVKMIDKLKPKIVKAKNDGLDLHSIRIN